MRRNLLLTVFGVVLALLAPAAHAGAKFEITLESGSTYSLERMEDGSLQVANASGELVGTLRSSAAGGFDVLDAGGNTIGSAAHINPEALEILDAHLQEGGGE